MPSQRIPHAETVYERNHLYAGPRTKASRDLQCTLRLPENNSLGGTMSRLFEEVPEAREFCDEIIGHVSDYRLHDRESFSELFSSVLSTSQIDMQGDAFAPNALEQMAAQVSREPVWLGFN